MTESQTLVSIPKHKLCYTKLALGGCTLCLIFNLNSLAGASLQLVPSLNSPCPKSSFTIYSSVLLTESQTLISILNHKLCYTKLALGGWGPYLQPQFLSWGKFATCALVLLLLFQFFFYYLTFNPFSRVKNSSCHFLTQVTLR